MDAGCVDTTEVRVELEEFLNNEFPIEEEDQELAHSVLEDVKGLQVWQQLDEYGNVNIPNASSKTNSYANLFVSVIEQETEKFIAANEDANDLTQFSDSLTYRFGVLKELVANDVELTDTEKTALDVSTSAIITILPPLTDLCTAASYCAGTSSNERMAGFGSFLKKAVGLAATVIATSTVNAFYFGVAGATFGSIAGPKGTIVGGVVGAAAGAVYGAITGLINGLTCKGIWGSKWSFGC